MDGTGVMVSLAMLVVGYLGWCLGWKYRLLRFLTVIAALTMLAGVAYLIISFGKIAMAIVGVLAVIVGAAGIGVSFGAPPSAPRSGILIVSILVTAVGVLLCWIL